MKEERYNQCRLQRPLHRGFDETISWIPDKFAIKGKVLRLTEDGKDSDGWVVEEVYEHSISKETAAKLSRVWKQTRKASDI